MIFAVITDTNGNRWETEQYDSVSDAKDILMYSEWLVGATGNQFKIDPAKVVSIEIVENNNV